MSRMTLTSMEDRQRLKAKLAANDIEKISQKAFVSRSTIYKYFGGGKIRLYLESQLLEAAAEVIAEKKVHQAQLRKRLEKLIE